MAGINAAVVGLLLAALVDPLWTGAVLHWTDAVLAVAGFVVLVRAWLPVWALLPVLVAADWGVGALI